MPPSAQRESASDMLQEQCTEECIRVVRIFLQYIRTRNRGRQLKRFTLSTPWRMSAAVTDREWGGRWRLVHCMSSSRRRFCRCGFFAVTVKGVLVFCGHILVSRPRAQTVVLEPPVPGVPSKRRAPGRQTGITDLNPISDFPFPDYPISRIPPDCSY
jgi:hypothetical protein